MSISIYSWCENIFSYSILDKTCGAYLIIIIQELFYKFTVCIRLHVPIFLIGQIMVVFNMLFTWNISNFNKQKNNALQFAFLVACTFVGYRFYD